VQIERNLVYGVLPGNSFTICRLSPGLDREHVRELVIKSNRYFGGGSPRRLVSLGSYDLNPQQKSTVDPVIHIEDETMNAAAADYFVMEATGDNPVTYRFDLRVHNCRNVTLAIVANACRSAEVTNSTVFRHLGGATLRPAEFVFYYRGSHFLPSVSFSRDAAGIALFNCVWGGSIIISAPLGGMWATLESMALAAHGNVARSGASGYPTRDGKGGDGTWFIV
jgi:hypothetical protein